MMAEMEHPLPDNTIPGMSGFGQFGPMEMGGMVSVMKIREGLAPGDYKDPGWYQHPAGTVAYEVENPAARLPQRSGPNESKSHSPSDAEVKVVRPGRKGGAKANR